MATIKELETKAGELYQEKVIRGFLHRCNGQVGLGIGYSYETHEVCGVYLQH